MSANKYNSTTNASIQRLAKAQKQLDVESIEKLRQGLSDLGIHVQVTGLEELASKTLEEYENSIRERIPMSIKKHLSEKTSD